jgi:UDP-N-acetylmuramoyl-L-alanyl-D-glutamate--2,6-diaminopimelate ligase
MKIKELVSKLSGILSINGSTNADITSIVYDSRKAGKGSLFVAIKGMSADGHEFIPQALEKGAVAVIGERDLKLENAVYIRVASSRRALAQSSAWFYGYPARKLKLIGVTGTNGKTTTTYLVKAMLDEAGIKTGVIGTIGNWIGNKLLPAERTTPESLELNQLFSQMLEEGVEYVAMEVSSHSLKLSRVDGIEFEVGIFTNLTQDHLDFHRTFEDYFNSKKKLFDFSRKAVINADDESGQKLIKLLDIPVTSYAIENKADLKAENVKITAGGVSYDLMVGSRRVPVSYRVPGRFSVYNSLAAIAAGLALGLSPDTMTKALEKVEGVPGRFEVVKSGQDFTVIVDYAHTPDGLENVLKTIKNFCTGRIITVFGCGGDRDKKKRPIMGKIASELSDYCIITSDNPRSEDPEAIIGEIEKGITAGNYEIIPDRKDAIKRAIEIAEKNDVVLIAGKGHENYQILKDKVIHFDDKEVAAEFLRKRGS